MLDSAHAWHFARRSKKYWVAALCGASFACGNYLFGDDDSSESLLSQYQQATQQLVTEVQPSSGRRPGSATNANPHTSRLQPAKAQAASVATPGQIIASNAPAQQQKSSRRVKPAQQPTSESAVAKADSPTQSELPPKSEPLANADARAKSETLGTEEPPAQEQSAGNQAELAQHAPAASAVSEPTPAAAPTESKPLPMVTYMPSPSQVTQKQLAPRMEIITPANTSTESPRAQELASQNVPFAVTKPVTTQAEVWLPANPVPSQPLPQIINVSRQAVAPPQPPKLASSLAELNDEQLPPIVSPDQVPRPGIRKIAIQPAAQTTPVLRIDLGKK
jgi:hypothetical protein